MFEDKTIQEKVDLYKKGFQSLSTKVPDNKRILDFTPGAPHWSIREIIAHLSDTEGIYFVRFRKVLTEPISDLLVFDQNSWYSRFNYGKKKIEESLQLLESLRNSNYRLLLSVAESEWNNRKYKQDNKEFSLDKLLDRNLNHFYGHLEIINKRITQFNEN